jgi:hypothetical protein
LRSFSLGNSSNGDDDEEQDGDKRPHAIIPHNCEASLIPYNSETAASEDDAQPFSPQAHDSTNPDELALSMSELNSATLEADISTTEGLSGLWSFMKNSFLGKRDHNGPRNSTFALDVTIAEIASEEPETPFNSSQLSICVTPAPEMYEPGDLPGSLQATGSDVTFFTPTAGKTTSIRQRSLLLTVTPHTPRGRPRPGSASSSRPYPVAEDNEAEEAEELDAASQPETEQPESAENSGSAANEQSETSEEADAARQAA